MLRPFLQIFSDIGENQSSTADYEKKTRNEGSNNGTDDSLDNDRKFVRNISVDVRSANVDARNIAATSSVPANLQQEFSKTINIPNVQIQKARLMRTNMKRLFLNFYRLRLKTYFKF